MLCNFALLLINEMKEIKLTRGMVALVDDEDFEYLNQWKWRAIPNNKTFYSQRDVQVNNHRFSIKMHRLIMNTPDSMEVDHIDHNGLNNQKSNLRNCTRNENMRNKITWGKSKYKGVCHLRNNKFLAHIRLSGKLNHLGTFLNEEDAARAYDRAALKYYGEFAHINIL